MRRREFITAAGPLVVWPRAAFSQQSSKPPTVAFLIPASLEQAKVRLEALRKGLRESGLVEGVHYGIETRFADGRQDRMPGLARELQSAKPAVFVVGGSVSAIRALEHGTPAIFTALAIDPVEVGFARSYARPGGMITGNVLNALGGEDTIAEKRITLFKELVPGLTRLGMFGFDRSIKPSLFEKELSAGTKVSSRLGFETREYGLKTIDDLQPALAAGAQDGIDGIYLSGDSLLINNLSRATPAILGAGKPTVGTYVEFARAGVLMTYASDLMDGWRRAGIYAAKILQGVKPGDLPIEQPTKFTLAINAKTASQLGISIPTALQALADELIE